MWGWDFPSPIELGRALIAGEPYRIGDLTVGWGIAKRLYLTPILGSTGAALAIFLYRRYGSLATAGRLLALLIACLLSFRYVIARLHLEAGNALSGPVFIATAFVLYELLRRWRSRPRWPAIAFAGLYLAAAVAMNVPLRSFTLVRSAAQFGSRLSSTVGLTPLKTPRGDGVFVWGADASEVEALVRYFDRETQRDSFLLYLTNRPGLYFFLRRINPTRFYQVPLMGPFQDEVLADLERNPPAAILLQTGTALDAPDGVPNSKRIPRVWEFVTNRYAKRERVGSTLVALPADSAFGPPKWGEPSINGTSIVFAPAPEFERADMGGSRITR